MIYDDLTIKIIIYTFDLKRPTENICWYPTDKPIKPLGKAKT